MEWKYSVEGVVQNEISKLLRDVSCWTATKAKLWPRKSLKLIFVRPFSIGGRKEVLITYRLVSGSEVSRWGAIEKAFWLRIPAITRPSWAFRNTFTKIASIWEISSPEAEYPHVLRDDYWFATVLFIDVFLYVHSCHGSQLGPSIQEKVVDGNYSHYREPALLCCSAGLGLTAHHAEERRLLFPPLHR